MKSIKIKTLGLVLLLTACSKVPISNRKQLNLLPESEMVSMSLTSYQDFLKQNPPINGTPESQMVKNIGAKIQSAVITYLGQNKMGDRVAGYKWEFSLLL